MARDRETVGLVMCGIDRLPYSDAVKLAQEEKDKKATKKEY